MRYSRHATMSAAQPSRCSVTVTAVKSFGLLQCVPCYAMSYMFYLVKCCLPFRLMRKATCHGSWHTIRDNMKAKVRAAHCIGGMMGKRLSTVHEIHA